MRIGGLDAALWDRGGLPGWKGYKSWKGWKRLLVPDTPCFGNPAHTVQLGQSTSYVTLDSLAILTDPALSDRTIPSRLAPQRLRPAPCTLDELRRVDVVLVSHKWVWVGGGICPVLLGHFLLGSMESGLRRRGEPRRVCWCRDGAALTPF